MGRKREREREREREERSVYLPADTVAVGTS